MNGRRSTWRTAERGTSRTTPPASSTTKPRGEGRTTRARTVDAADGPDEPHAAGISTLTTSLACSCDKKLCSCCSSMRSCGKLMMFLRKQERPDEREWRPRI